MAAAFNAVGSGAGGGVVALSGPEPAAVADSWTTTTKVVALSGPEPAPAATTSQAAATLQGRGGLGSAAADTPARSQPTPTDSNAWAAILFSLAALLVGAVAWIAIDRRRGRLTGPSLAAFCARNPADSAVRRHLSAASVEKGGSTGVEPPFSRYWGSPGRPSPPRRCAIRLESAG